MKTNAKKYALGLCATLSLGLGAARLLYASSSNSAAAPASAPAEAPAPAIPARAWKEGDSFLYDLDTTRSTSIRPASQAEQRISVHLAGALRLTVIGAEANEIHLRADVAAQRVELSPQFVEEGKKWASHSFYVRARKGGEIASFLFPKDVEPQARILLKGIVDSTQMVARPTHAATWQALELDVTGQYNAHYRILDESTLEKEKTSYVQTRGVSGLVPIPRDTQYAVKSRSTFGLDPSGWPKTLTEDETLEVSAQNNKAVGTIKTRASLVAIESHPEWIGPLPSDFESDAESEAAAIALSMKQADLNTVGGKSFPEINASLNAADPKSRNQAQAKMSALLRVKPEEAAKVTEEILHGSGDANSKKRLIGALGNAGTKEAQHELARMLEMKEDGVPRVNAAVALSLTKHPTEETAEALKKAMDSTNKKVANTAALAAGNVVRSMNAGQYGDTADAVQLLIERLASATSDSEKQVYLDALGNTGDARALAAITPYLSHTNTILRATATGALKFMSGPFADQAIITATSDPELLVRKSAAHTIAFRPISGVLAAFDTLLRTEPEASIRIEILKGMNVKVNEDPAILDSVAWVLENDPSENVKAFAKEILDGESPAP